MVAHCLAKYGLGTDDETVWVEEYPDFVHVHVTNDVILS